MKPSLSIRSVPGMFGLGSIMLWTATLLASAQPHPLDPLSTNELSAVTRILQTEGKVNDHWLFPLIALQEPSKEEVFAWQPGRPIHREAFVVALDRSANKTFEALVDLTARSVVSWRHVPGVQPMWTSPEEQEAIELIRKHPEWQAAMRGRGITNFAQVTVSNWALGPHPLAGRKEGRFFRAVFYYRGGQTNHYGPSIEGVQAIVDLNKSKVVEIIDTGTRPLAKESTDFFDAEVRGRSRAGLKPLVLAQPQGPSFRISGNEIRWDRWRFRYGFHPREGLVLYLVRYEDQGRDRSVLYRASLSEMLVPYGDPAETWFWRNAIDEGEYGLGKCSAPLVRGQSTPTHATLLDVPISNDLGRSELWPDRIDIYEREGDVLWTHYDYLAQMTEGRRARELVMGFIATVGNYDYSYHWVFRQDGSLEFVAELTGIVLIKGVVAAQCQVCRQRQGQSGTIEPVGDDRVGTLVAPHTVGVNHQHFINMRLDFDLDGLANSVKEINVQALSGTKSNPHRNGFIAKQTVFGKEREAARDLNLATRRTWAVYNPNITTSLGHYPAYELEPGVNALPFLAREGIVRKVAGFVDHHFFATRFRSSEVYGAGLYPTQPPKPDGLRTWIRDNETILNQDVVIWYTFGLTHVARPEDYPVMPAARAGFRLLPKGFFNRNPALDVPAPD